MTNHDKIIISAKELFLQFDAEAICSRLSLRADTEKIYINFLGDIFSINKVSGDIFASDGVEANYQEYLVIFDFICRKDAVRPLVGRFCPVNSLGNMVHPGVSEAILYQSVSPVLGGNIDGYKNACKSLAGRDFPIGDHSYVIDVIEKFPAVIQLWEADDEFPASVRLLWDESSLSYFKYETIWYLAGEVLAKICKLAGNN